MEGPEDILSTSLETLYDYAPITHSAPGALFTFTSSSGSIKLSTPDPAAQNWSLHASAIWLSAIYIADHLGDLELPDLNAAGKKGTRVLELGAAAGLPSILIAQVYPHLRVTASDYPDPQITQTLEGNVRHNGVADRVSVVPHAWGTDPAPLLMSSSSAASKFSTIVAADILWNPSLHSELLSTLTLTLAETAEARVHLVAGLHTGRYTIAGFLRAAEGMGLAILQAEEREVNGRGCRAWDVEREEEDGEKERRRWVVWIILRWRDLVRTW